MSDAHSFHTLTEVAKHLRNRLETRDHLLLFAHNGTGKTRLSMLFRETDQNEGVRDTLYFNAFTEDLFNWDNNQRVLRINSDSQFVTGLREQEMESRIREFLPRYADFYFFIDYDNWAVRFGRDGSMDGTDAIPDAIKVSRGEERLFIWCFFLAVAKLALDGEEAYSWVKYLYIDDPISSLDDNNAIAVGVGLTQLLGESDSGVKTIISTHHALFFNVMANELPSKTAKYLMSRQREDKGYTLKDTRAKTSFQHVGLLWQLHEAAQSDQIYTYHFNILRSVLEKTAAFHGYGRFSECLRKDENDVNGLVHARMVNLLSHGNYSLFDPVEMVEDNKRYFRDILNNLAVDFRFNPEIFSSQGMEVQSP